MMFWMKVQAIIYLSVGADQTPFTSDDILPDVEPKNIGLIINPSSH